MSRAMGCLWLALMLAAPARAQDAGAERLEAVGDAAAPVSAAAPANRTGREIFERFRAGLADPKCDGNASARWRSHFAHTPKQLAAHDGDVLPLFGYVVDALRDEGLPTEFALIPFVESGYKPGARSPQGPAGLWQMIAITARHHQVPIRPGYDGRLSPVDSTAAAVRYLKSLHRRFAGDWRLAVMAYNAGEYRVLGALKRSGQTARNARPESLPGLSPITQAYVRKLHALSCLMEQAQASGDWTQSLDRPVPRLEAVSPSDDVDDLRGWARRHDQDPVRLQRLNPALAQGRIARIDGRPARLLAFAAVDSPHASGAADASDTPAQVLTPAETGDQATAPPTELPVTPGVTEGAIPLVIADASAPAAAATDEAATGASAPRRHVVARGDSASRIAHRYGVRLAELLDRNALDARSVLRPGQVLLIDADATGPAPAGTR